MSFDYDPQDQANVSGSDFAVMVDEIKLLQAINAELLEALRELLEHVETPPNRNCSCHIAPPCGDCVDYSGLRAAIEMSKSAIAKAKGEQA